MKYIFISIIAGILILSISLGMATQIRYDMPFNISFNSLTPNTQQQVECLAENIYFEAAFEPTDGQVAVAFVTLNRLKTGLFGSDICGVVKQKSQNVCQFSWYCEAMPLHLSTNKLLTRSSNPVYNSVRDLATSVYMNYDSMHDPSKGALFYHADYVKPGWKNMRTTAVIGRHIFYNKRSST